MGSSPWIVRQTMTPWYRSAAAVSAHEVELVQTLHGVSSDRTAVAAAAAFEGSVGIIVCVSAERPGRSCATGPPKLLWTLKINARRS